MLVMMTVVVLMKMVEITAVVVVMLVVVVMHFCYMLRGSLNLITNLFSFSVEYYVNTGFSKRFKAMVHICFTTLMSMIDYFCVL